LRGSLLVAGCYERFLFGLDPASSSLKKVRSKCGSQECSC